MRECIGGPFDGERMHDADPQLRGIAEWLPGATDVPVRFGRYVRVERNGQEVFEWRQE